LAEETGLLSSSFEIGPVTNDVFVEEDKHYVTLFVVAKYEGGDATVLEPEKCSEWRWFDWNQLPSPLFLPIQNLLKGGFRIVGDGSSSAP
jgi:8-oxo-dGTP diphosphatase